MTPAALIVAALTTLNDRGFPVLARSSLWRSRAWPLESSAPDYVNAVCRIDTRCATAQATLLTLLTIEDYYGRVRNPSNRWAPRSLDLDLLDFDGHSLETENLVLPHPRLARRAFVLQPLLEVAPDWRHPVTAVTGRALLDALVAAGDDGGCARLEPPETGGNGDA
jgi:2-amino-4-hydroxy-6-hydroxymethyldihydropteridine diphosphokinase